MKKTVLITGGTGGIGEGLCHEFAEAGYNIVLHYFSSEEKALMLKSHLEQKYGISLLPVCADLKKEDEIAKLASAALETFDRVDVLINNAGISHQELFQDVSPEKVREIFLINAIAPMSLAARVISPMLRNGQGRIINISSMWGVSGASCEVHYSASKAALIGFTKALAKEVGPSNITVNCIAPGFIDTKMNSSFSGEVVKEIIEATPLSRKGTPDDISSLALFLASEKASFITGQIISVDGGFIL